MVKRKTNFPSQRQLDPILDNPDWHRVNSARYLHEMNERMAGIEDPLDETNARLAGVERHSREIHELSSQAVVSSQKTAKRAFILSMIAVIITVALAMSQIAYNEFWRVPREDQATQAVLSDLKAEIADMKKQQMLSVEDLKNVTIDKEKDAVIILKEIKEVLERPNDDKVNTNNE